MGQSIERRRTRRIDLRRTAVLITSDGIEYNVTVLDLSGAGIRISLAEALRVDEIVALRVEKGREFRTRISWTLGGEAGGIFVNRDGEPELP